MDAAARHDAMNLSNTERNQIVSFLFFRSFYPLSESKAKDALFASCMRNGNGTVTHYLLRLGVEDATIRHGNSILHMSLLSDYEPGVKAQLSNGANPDITQRDSGMTALMFASDKCSEAYVTMLIDARADLDLQDHQGATALMHAVAKGSYEAARMFVTAGADVTLCNDRNRKAVDIAKSLGPRRGDKIAQLLESHEQAQRGKELPSSAYEISVQHSGQSAYVTDWAFTLKWGEFAKARQELERLSTSERDEVMKQLSDKGFIPLNWQNINKALVWACSNRMAREAQLLLAMGADIESKDKNGFCILCIAIIKNTESTFRHLISCGAGLDSVRYAHGRTPLMLATLSCGARLDPVKYANGRTLLMLAALHGREAVVRNLLSVGADPTLHDGAGLTALQVAESQGNDKIAKMLRAYLQGRAGGKESGF